MSDKMDLDVLTQLLNEYFDCMTQIALKHGGTIDKYMGDAIYIFFGDPETSGAIKDACRCTRMALEMRDNILLLNQKWKAVNINNVLQVRMGIHSGYVSVGNFGSNFRMDYTLVGSAVKQTDRLQAIAKPNEIIVSEATQKLIRDYFVCELSRRKFKTTNAEEAFKIYTVNKSMEAEI
jgi:class 3 adenylate cyclase